MEESDGPAFHAKLPGEILLLPEREHTPASGRQPLGDEGFTAAEMFARFALRHREMGQRDGLGAVLDAYGIDTVSVRIPKQAGLQVNAAPAF